MSDKSTSSGVIKTFARIMFVIGVILTVIMVIAMVAVSIYYSNEMNSAGIAVAGVICSVVICILSIFCLVVEKAFLLSYAEIAEDVRDVRNILTRRDSRS